MRGGHNRRAVQVPRPEALAAWPTAPAGFTEREAAAWAELGEALMPLASTSASDLILARLTARVMAKVTAAVDDQKLKVSTLNALVRLEADLLHRMGLGQQARKTVDRLPSKADEAARKRVGAWGVRRLPGERG